MSEHDVRKAKRRPLELSLKLIVLAFEFWCNHGMLAYFVVHAKEFNVGQCLRFVSTQGIGCGRNEAPERFA